MGKIIVKIKLRAGLDPPQYASSLSSGCDLLADIEKPILLSAGARGLIPTGLFLELPEDIEAQVRSRSGLTLKHGIVVANGVGTIDADYRGEIKVILANISSEDYTINPHDRIAQLVFAPVLRAQFSVCADISATERGEGGFGHSGR